MEIANSYLVLPTLGLVQNGDLLVDDTHHSWEVLHGILSRAAYSIGRTIPACHIYRSLSGKQDGYIWPHIQGKYDVQRHYGSNDHSEVLMPQHHGIPTERVTIGGWTEVEQALARYGAMELSQLLRCIRLSNPNPMGSVKYTLYDEHIRHNVPLMLYFATKMHRICKDEGLTRVLLITPFEGITQQVLDALYPNLDSVPFHSSPLDYKEATPEYVHYVKSVYQE